MRGGGGERWGLDCQKKKIQLSSSSCFFFYQSPFYHICIKPLFDEQRFHVSEIFFFLRDRIFKWSCCFGNCVTHFGRYASMCAAHCLIIERLQIWKCTPAHGAYRRIHKLDDPDPPFFWKSLINPFLCSLYFTAQIHVISSNVCKESIVPVVFKHFL